MKTATTNATLRLLIDPPLDGAMNMARDEALLVRVGRGEARATLRLYQWMPATLSLGYFQSHADVLRLNGHLRRMPVVRRLTGGGAIVHADELTYSLVVPMDDPSLQNGPTKLYELVHDAAITMLEQRGVTAQRVGCGACDGGNGHAQRGPFLCFERRHALDVIAGGRKILGSAQRRTGGAILQHGSLQLTGLPGIDLDRFAPDRLTGPFVNAMAERFGVAFEPSKWHQDTLALAQDLFDKYAGAEWTQRR